MAIEYYTTVTVSEKFWNKLVSEKLKSKFPVYFISENAGFSITSKYRPAIWDLIALSNELPEEKFNVIITTDNIYQNIIEYYEFRGGATFFLRSEPIYYFSISDEVKKSVDPIIIDSFQEEIIESLDRINDFVPSYQNTIGYQDQRTELITNVQFEYGNQNCLLRAKRVGLTYVEIEMKSF